VLPRECEIEDVIFGLCREDRVMDVKFFDGRELCFGGEV
jgi:hypothetical protein